MPKAFEFLISGIILGLGSGLTPGPLLTLVISETLKHGIKEGFKISSAPIFTDLPIVLGTIYILSRLSDIMPILGVISFLGAIFIFYLAFEIISLKGADLNTDDIKPHSIKKGMIANFLNPSPYMFWLTVGAPMVVRANTSGFASVFSFIFSFYICLMGSKMIVAIVAGRSRDFLKSSNYRYAMRFLGIVLLVFGALFIWNSLKYFGLV